MQIKGCGAVVTGGASGLGEASVRELKANGAQVAILDFDESRGAALAQELGPGVIFCKTDVTEESMVQAAVAQAAEAFGGVHVALNCAGVIGPMKVLSKKGGLSIKAYNQVIQINLVGTMTVIRYAVEKMMANKPNADGEKGVVINTASVAAFEGQIGQVAYSSSKAGVVGLTLPLAREFADYGVRAMTVAPGLFETPMMAMLPDKIKQSLVAMVPFPKRLGKPSEFASLVKHIIENPVLNGETIRLDQAIRMGAR